MLFSIQYQGGPDQEMIVVGAIGGIFVLVDTLDIEFEVHECRNKDAKLLGSGDLKI